MSDSDDRGTVLVVDDDPSLTEVYAAWLEDEYRVRTATSGEEALDRLDAGVDVVLLDRRMPELSGEAVLETIRRDGYGCRVAMVSGVRPDADIVEMGFDDYVVKPVTREDLRAVVADLLARSSYSEGIQELFSLAAKRAALAEEADVDGADVAAATAELDERIEELRSRIDDAVSGFGPEDFRVAFRDIDAVDARGDGPEGPDGG